jgi:hypothetical protein
MFNPIKCGICISRLTARVQGYDPREMVKDCAWKTLSKGRGGKAFRNCLEKKIRNTWKDVRNPERFVTEIWKEISKKCGG